MTGTNDSLRDTGAYALNSLSDEERRLFDRAADSDPQLRAEADELTATATLLGLATTPVQPSAGLKASLMASIAATPQLPAQLPAQVPASGHGVADSDVAGGVDLASSQGSAPEPAVVTAQSSAQSSAERRAGARWFTRPGLVLAAAAAAVALLVGGGVVGSVLGQGSGSGQTVDQNASALAAINAAPDMRSERKSLLGGGVATVLWSEVLGQSAVVVDGLPELPSDSVYEAWYIGADGTIASAGLFSAAGATSWHVLDGAMTPGDTVGVTVEPAGGSEQPTTDPILVVATA